jgi:hypothetical protein
MTSTTMLPDDPTVATTVTTLSTMREAPTEMSKAFLQIISKWLETMTPKYRPRLWIAINGVVLLISVTLLRLAIMAKEDSRALKFANEYYMVYNYGTTLIWCLESALSAFVLPVVLSPSQYSRARIRRASIPGDDYDEEEYNKKKIEDCQSTLLNIQFALSAYFVGDSMVVLWRFKWKKEDIDIIMVEVVLNCFAYSVGLITTVQFYRRSQKQRRSSMVDSQASLNHEVFTDVETTMLLS